MESPFIESDETRIQSQAHLSHKTSIPSINPVTMKQKLENKAIWKERKKLIEVLQDLLETQRMIHNGESEKRKKDSQTKAMSQMATKENDESNLRKRTIKEANDELRESELERDFGLLQDYIKRNQASSP